MEKWGTLGLKRPKNMVLIGSKALVGDALVKAPKDKWGKMGENWGNCGKFWMLDGKLGNLGAEKVKKMVLIGNKARGGGMGENGGKWGKWGNQTSPP